MQKLLILIFIIMPIYTKEPIIIAHRGASAYEPENTLSAFKYALSMKTLMIELDVHVSKSGELIVFHDETIDRITNSKGKIKDLHYRTLRTFDVGKGEHIPLLSEVFDLVDKKATIIIELKVLETAELVADLIEEYVKNKDWSYDNFIVISFSESILKKFKEYSAKVKIGVVFGFTFFRYFLSFFNKNTYYFDVLKNLKADYAIFNYNLITKELVDKSHQLDIKIFAYTVNKKSVAQNLKQLNVDGIITDYPDILK